MMTAAIPLHTIYYYIFSSIFGFIVKRRNVAVKSANIFPIFMLILISFFGPAGYIVFKYFYSSKDNLADLSFLNSGIDVTRLDIALLVFILLLNGLVMFLFFYFKQRKGKNIYSMIGKMTFPASPDRIKIDDPGEYGFIETGLMEFQERMNREKAKIVLFNDYISKNMREEMSKNGIKLEGEEKTAAISTIRFKFTLNEYSPEKYMKTMNSIFTLIGEYADEYEAYPFFQLNKAVIVYGVPYFYVHESLNAIEATQETITDIENLIAGEGGKVSIHSGLYKGNIVVGALNTKGRELQEYSVTGEGVEMSERIALAAENIDVNMLVAIDMVESLQNKFYPEKTFKMKMKNGADLNLSLLKV
jgi:hypothetical protein